MEKEMIRLYLCETFSFEMYGNVKIEQVENRGTAITMQVESPWCAIPEAVTIEMLDLMTWFYGRTKQC